MPGRSARATYPVAMKRAATAESLSLPKGMLSKIENMQASPSLDTLARARDLAQRELLSRGAVAGVDLQLGAVGGVAAWVVEAQSGLRVEQGPVGLLNPFLA